jgi:hypothetical protein
MKTSLRRIILTGGALNLLLALFHIFLCYQIYRSCNTMPIYPLLQMFSIGGMLMIFFLAYTSLRCPEEMVSTNAGRAVIVLNILVYFTRVIGEFVLSPQQNYLIVGLCSFLTILYAYILVGSRVYFQERRER